jgi:hypothetical protein
MGEEDGEGGEGGEGHTAIGTHSDPYTEIRHSDPWVNKAYRCMCFSMTLLVLDASTVLCIHAVVLVIQISTYYRTTYKYAHRATPVASGVTTWAAWALTHTPGHLLTHTPCPYHGSYHWANEHVLRIVYSRDIERERESREYG